MADSIKYEMEIHCVKVFMGSNGWCLKRLPLFFKDGGIGLENIYQMFGYGSNLSTMVNLVGT